MNLKLAKALAILLVSMIALFAGAHLFIQVMGWLTVFMWFAGGLAIAGGAAYVGYLTVVKPKLPQMKLLGGKSGHKVYDGLRRQVYLFREQPTKADLFSARDELHLAQLELKGEVFPVKNNENVTVLEDPGNGAVKVRVSHPVDKKLDQEGWVPKSALIEE